MILTSNIVTIGLGLGLTAFTVATIVLAVQKGNLINDLNDAQEKLDLLEEEIKHTSTTPITTSTTTPSPTTQPPKPAINYRLPGDILPKHYDLYLYPHENLGEFSGQETIDLKIVKSTQTIILHVKDLNINYVSLINVPSSNTVTSFELDKEREFLIVHTSEIIPEGSNVSLLILFDGQMEGKIVGLYSSSYTKEDGSLKTIATSKFEPTYARQAFPCFDEPAMKATYNITLAYPADQDYHALSNMNELETKNLGSLKETTFNQSVPMSTYLSCFIVSDFVEKHRQINTQGIGEEFTMRVFASPEQVSKVDFALDCGARITEHYIQYFKVEYPLPKLDMAAIPDFVSGAMETWGLVTFRETSLLYDKETSSTVNKQRVASVVAHELAHMWFGNLVTMMWWNDLWLNEGFASYIENKGVNSIFPEWKMDDQFIIATVHGVLSLDATLGSHPIIQKVENPDQITEIFDTITYSKGSSIIRMMEDFLTPDVFEKAVTNYLNEYKYSNAVTDDFLAEIDKLGLEINVSEIMRTWTEQMGFPVVEVEKISDVEYKLTQKRFFSNPEDYNGDYNDSPNFNYRWSIPITFHTDRSSVVERGWFFHDAKEFTIKLPSAVKWIKFNKNQVGYYRVNYPEEMWKSLVDQLVQDPDVFSIGDRASLLNDAFSLADSTQLPYDTALDITTYLSKELEYVPWSVAASKLTSLKNTLMFTDIYRDYITYARKLIASAYESVGWTVGEDHLKNRLRITTIGAACSLGLEACTTEISKRFNEWLDKPSVRPHPDLRETIYYYGMVNSGTEKNWEKVWDLFVNELDASEKSKMMYGLSGIQLPWVLSRYVQLAWDENYVRGQDYFTCLQYIAANPVGESIVWNYVRENWPKLVDRFGLNERYLGSMIPSITSRFSTQTQLDEMQEFFNKYPEAGAGTAARVRALETVKNNIKWLEENKDKVGDWLKKQENYSLNNFVLISIRIRLISIKLNLELYFISIVLTSKNLAILFGVAAIALAVSTIVLAVQKANVQDELNGALDKLNNQETTLAPVSPGQTPTDSTSTSTKTPNSSSTQPADPTASDPTDFPWPSLTDTTPTSTSTTQNPNFPNPNDVIFRLPHHVRPWQYKLYLNPDLQKKTFEGTVSIGLSIDNATNLIALHSKDLQILGISILEVMGRMRIRVKDYYTDPVRELLLIEFYEVLQLFVPYTLSISFRGSLEGLSGFYSSSYTDPNGEQIIKNNPQTKMKFTKKQPPHGHNNNRHSLSSASDIATDIMYPPIQPKIPPVRPRSSLSTDEHHRFRDAQIHSRKRSNTIFTLIGFCVFLLVLVAFLLGALVYVGRTIAATGMSNVTVLLEEDDIYGEQKQSGKFLFSNDSVINQKTKPIILFPSSNKIDRNNLSNGKPKHTTMPSLSAKVMSTSKILNQLGYRLPKEIRPKHYNLFLNPDLKEKTFSGNITIKLEILKPIQFIPVHAKKLSVETMEVLALSTGDAEPQKIKPSLTFQHPQLEYWVTEFSDPLKEGNYSLKLRFNGSLTDRIVGLYQSSYKDKATNETRWMATSKFEPTYARQAFPCFDEPDMKAFFEVTLVHPTDGGYHALSNMNEVKQTVKGNVTEVVFADSVQMSTYLACFIVSDFHHKMKKINAAVGSDFDMRVFATAAQMEKATYALDTGATIIEHYINYFNLAYPLPKLDMAAIPDFVSGAMEHWGLVTFRETALLYDSNTSSSANKQRVATVIAHELAHMWFGNLVTMKWWNDLWLNEGFASYIEYKGVNSVHPNWKMLDQFLTDDLHGVLKLDATLASHPIVQTVESPNQITELFDSITYSKGASVIRMLEGFVGEDVFKEAVHNYLERYQFSNAETDDFFSEFESFSLDYDVKLIMKTWTVQMGFPVVEVSKVTPTQLKLTQKRFFSNPGDYNETYSDSEFNYRWTIPITYTTSANPVVQRTWFNYDDSEIIIDLPSAIDWIKINKDQVGYYRVNYPQEIWEEINKALLNTPTAFSVSDRAHLLNDAFTLADATQLTFKTALDLTKFLQNELEYVPWNVASSKLLSMKNLLYYTDVFKDFRKYASGLLNKAYENVGWEVDEADHLKNLLRVSILDAACSFGHDKCLQEAGSRFTAWLSNPSVRPKPDLRSIIYLRGMSVAGNEETWQQMWDIFKAETDASEKAKLMQGLSGIKEPWILQRFIELAWDENNVRGQDYFTCLQYIARNPVGQSLVWDYVRENWEKLVERFGINERYLGRLIPAITGRFTTNQKLEEMEIFFAKYPEAGAGTAARKEALENVKYNINWLKVNKNQIAEWLASNN
ncbi:uncharacterized protein LOC129938333 [Eupeodes corollae]|uniref:uncharacterized protein LOC129938333 n=1 Tax=Eupeodes corollae TaxID=290404 RepID=UPI00248FDAE1|nr:uncharacterized protein LOC129938333 [Eupeodes corollae]